MKTVYLGIGVGLLVAGISYFYLVRAVAVPVGIDTPVLETSPEVSTVPVVTSSSTTPQDPVTITLSTTTFSGIIEEVNTGCFADGECYVSVSGVHITTLLGRRQEVVGTVIGVPGFGDLENFIGEPVEVYAQKLADGTYTLYGDEGFYIKLRTSGGGMVQMGKTVQMAGVQITPQSLLEDSRCPSDVVCVWAGTVRVRAQVESEQGVLEQIFVLNETVETEGGKITLLRVEPNTESTTNIDAGQYVFYFEVRAR